MYATILNKISKELTGIFPYLNDSFPVVLHLSLNQICANQAKSIMSREIKSAKDIQAVLVPASNVNDFKDRLVKLIPSEIITAYVTIQGLIAGAASQNGNTDMLLWIVIAVLLVLTPVYLYYIGNVRKWEQIIFTAFAFVLWVIVIGSPVKEILGFQSSFIGSIFLVLYTLMIPFFYKG